MRKILVLTLIFISFLSIGQTRTITGKVVDEDFQTLPEVRIQNADTVSLGTTDKNGYFKIELPVGIRELVLTWIGMEPTLIKVPASCDKIEVIMMYAGSYDFMSSRKIDRLRRKTFDKLLELHSRAVNKGIFIDSPCYIREFDPYKPRLDEIGKENIVIRKQIKETYKKLEIGDTIRIPCVTSYRSDGTDRTTLNVWSSYSRTTEFDCTIQGVVIDKDNHKNGYNLIYKVTDHKSCKYDSLVYQNKNVVVGEVFRHNMKYDKVLVK
jgi:hypothetical protein